MNAPDIAISQVLSGKSGKDENFPVASWLLSPAHRGIILAFYRFVRAADDIVDHPSLDQETKFALIDRLEAGLLGKGAAEPEAEPLRRALEAQGMTPRHPLDMLIAFRRDIDSPPVRDWDDLILYCRHSAMPVGRFVLDVHGESESLWPGNDSLCAALQIINHLQDCAKDYQALGRIYLPVDRLAAAGASPADLAAPRASPALRGVIGRLNADTKILLEQSAGFARAIRDSRLGSEVAIIQGVAERLTQVLETRDPLFERVHLSKFGYLGAALAGMFRHRLRARPAAPIARERQA